MSTLAPALRSVDHIGIVVADLDGALRYWSSVLGLPVTHEEVLTERSARIAFVDAGNVLLQFIEPIANDGLIEFLHQGGDGLHHVCFSVSDIDETLEAIPGEPADGIFPGGRGRRACFLADRPSGLRIELYEDVVAADDGQRDRPDPA